MSITKHIFKYIKTFCLLLLLTVATTVRAQVDSLLNKETIKLLEAYDSSPDAAVAQQFFNRLDEEQFSDSLVVIPRGLAIDSVSALVWYWAADYYYAAQHYHASERYGLKALILMAKGGDPASTADCLNLLAIVNVRQSHFEEAAKYAKQCYELDMQSGDMDRISSSLNTISAIYLSARQPQQAEPYVLRGIQMAEETGNMNRLAIMQGMASEIYVAMEDYQQALDYAEKAYNTDRAQHNDAKAMIRLSMMSRALIGLERYDEAEKSLTEAIAYFRTHDGMRQSLAISLNQMGAIRKAQQRVQESAEAYREAARLMMLLGDRRGEMHARQGLYETLWKVQPDSAYVELERFNALRDSLYDMASAESLARYNAEFGVDMLREEHQSMRVVNIIVAVVLTVLIIVMCILFYRYRRKQKERIRELMVALEQVHTHSSAPDGDAPVNESIPEFLLQVNAVVNKLMENGQVDITSVASEMNLSPSQFRRRVSSYTELTPSNYIMTVRMMKAKELLEEYPKYNIAEIAVKCGFADNAHFAHNFKRLFGISPSQYIKKENKQ